VTQIRSSVRTNENPEDADDGGLVAEEATRVR